MAGDAQNDSPGHNAAYGSYTLMDTEGNGVKGSKKIVSTELVHRSQVPNSNHLEPEGLKLCLKQMQKDKIKIPILATDRHLMVGKILSTKKDINHQFDVWHLVKSLLKKLWSKAKLKENEYLAP